MTGERRIVLVGHIDNSLRELAFEIARRDARTLLVVEEPRMPLDALLNVAPPMTNTVILPRAQPTTVRLPDMPPHRPLPMNRKERRRAAALARRKW